MLEMKSKSQKKNVKSEIVKRKQAKKAKEPEDESDQNSSSDEDNDEVISSQPKSILSQAKRKAKEVDSSSDDDDMEPSDDDDDDDVIPNDKNPTKVGMKRNAAKDENLKKNAKKPKLEVTPIEKSKLKAVTVEKQKPKATAFEMAKIKNTDVEKPSAKKILMKEKKKHKATTGEKEKLEATSGQKQKIQKSSTTLFVCVPPKNVFDSTKVHQFFAVRGMENSVRALKDRRNFGFVDLVDPTLVGKALKLSGERLDGLELRIERANEPPELSGPERKRVRKEQAKQLALLQKQAQEEAADRVKLFVKNLPSNATKKLLKKHFPSATSLRLPRSVDKSLKGFAFVEFANESVAEKVMAEKQGSMLGDKAIAIDFVGKKSVNVKPGHKLITDDPSKTLFVKQLAFKTTTEDLLKAFKPCSSVRLATFPDSGKSRGYAFVLYESPEQAEAARLKMHESRLDGRTIVVGFARTPEENTAAKKKRKEEKQAEKTKENDKPKNGAEDTSVSEPREKNSTSKVKKSKEEKKMNESAEPAKDLVKPKKLKKEKKLKPAKMEEDNSEDEDKEPRKKKKKLNS